MSDFLLRRDGFWHFQRRVPNEFADLDGREIVRQSTKIRVADDPKGVRAGEVAKQQNRILETYWKGLIDGKVDDAEAFYNAARAAQKSMGLSLVSAADLAQQPLHALAGRIHTLAKMDRVDDKVAVAAALGGISQPVIKLSELFDRFEHQVTADMTDLSPDQKRKWRNPKVRAVANLIRVIGDKPITEITHNDALDFSEWWQAKVKDDGVNPGTANKDMGHITRMIFVVSKRHRLGIGKVFEGMRLEGGVESSRPPFDPEYVQKRILAPGALAAMNDEARRVVFLIAGTGLRPTEAVNLNRKTIVLDVDIPHVKVIPDGRRMKTSQSQRDIPLVGVALAAARAQPDGFPRYHDSGAELSATVNKFLSEHDLRQGGDRTLYSLRHTFKDQLTAVEAEDSMIDALMGHKETGSKYGTGPSLKLKLKFLHLIAFSAPPAV
jgi:integrase